ncbi:MULTISPECIES: hypothetical protein [unclassified Pseudomonas]|uniref:hypothetical protein n=1 Tax=unclassified Pseudomonas TaxID=196821 RepID=UPI0021BADAF6|nr:MULTISPECIES: hypothetical protein [unclassified Pseudomonas]MCT8163481.1 hypothetical protein [Pseudomonas sp. HD6422]MCT8182523.1 hypothetical protein [Pseudomonas sp. HD6421]
MTTNLEELKQRGQAGAEVGQPDERPPFDRAAALRQVIKEKPYIKGTEATLLVDKMEAAHNRTAVGSATAQSIVRHYMGKTQAQRREMAKELRAIGYRGRYASAGEVLDLMTEAHNRALDDVRPSARAILRQQVGEDDAPRLATTKSRYIKSAMQKLADHPTARLMEAEGMRTARDVSEICKSSLAGGVAALYQRADVAKRLAGLTDTQAEQAREIAALKARLVALETRQDVAESGEHWHDVAKRMRSEGATYGSIAKATGQGRSAVSNYLLRNA